MNSKHYACISLALYVLVFGLAFYWIEFVYTPEDKKPDDDVVYIELVAPEEEPEPEKKKPIVNATPNPDLKPKKEAKDASKHSKPDPETKSQKAMGKDKEVKSPKAEALFPGVTGGLGDPVVSGNQGEPAPETSGAGESYSLNPDGSDGVNKGNASPPKLKGDYLPPPDENRVKQWGVVRVKVTINNNGDVIEKPQIIHKGTTITDSDTKNAILEVAEKAKFEESKAFFRYAIIEYYCNQGNFSFKVK